MFLVSIFLATLFLAYSNGANDNFKGVATLFGSRTTSYQTAVLWGSLTTFAGGVAATFLGRTLLKKFTGQDIFPDYIVSSPEIHLSVAITTALILLIAALTGFPISTTHTIIGALLGAGLVAVGLEVNFIALGNLFILPLLVSPFLAVCLTAVSCKLFTYVTWQPPVKLINVCHFISAGIVCFNSSFNNTPKIASMLLIIDYFSVQGGMLTIAMAMALGGLINSYKIGQTMSQKITKINADNGFAANIVTNVLLIVANYFALPVSKTQVSVSSIFAVGIMEGKYNVNICYQIFIAWILTLPTATIISGIVYRLLQNSS